MRQVLSNEVFYHFCTYRLLLWDCDDRAYSYYIEVSTDQKKWTCVADKTKEACRLVCKYVGRPLKLYLYFPGHGR